MFFLRQAGLPTGSLPTGSLPTGSLLQAGSG